MNKIFGFFSRAFTAARIIVVRRATKEILMSTSQVTAVHDTEIVDLLLEHGDLVNKWGGTDKMTPLCWSSYHGDIEIVERLLKEKANRWSSKVHLKASLRNASNWQPRKWGQWWTWQFLSWSRPAASSYPANLDVPAQRRT